MTQLADLISRELLPFVQTPGQYAGQEINQQVGPGDWEAADVRVAIAFPDTYAIGMSHLGCQIIYTLCNQTPGVTAERVYSPWIDAEAVMRAKHIPLFTWDTRNPVASADILAVSLQYELTFTNVLTLLDLAGIPLRTVDRDDSHPLVIAGGPQADAPEPMADFIDLFVLGDGEVSISAILEAYGQYKAGGTRRRDMIRLMAERFPWAYAPSLYDVSYQQDGTIRSIKPGSRDLPDLTTRCTTPDFEHATVPSKPLVPHVKVVQDRIAIEIMRGCPQRCRFCHAGYTKRPISRRSVTRIVEIAEEAYRATGCEEIGLLSLSSSDYPQLTELASRINEQFSDRRVSIALPSLRVDKMLANVPSMVNAVRKSGLTMAVEAAREDMRSAIRKVVVQGDLLDGVVQAYQAGWRGVKLYFMAGFPGERDDDIDGICELSQEVADAARSVRGMPARVHAAVGWLVPKPHTPLQWTAQPPRAYFEHVADRLQGWVRSRRTTVRFKMHDIGRSILEAVLSRGDRRLGQVIETAWRAGARFDGWNERFDENIWRDAFDKTGIDPAWYAHRERRLDEVLPWSHLAGGGPTKYLRREYEDLLAKIKETRTDPGGNPAPSTE